MQSQFSSNILVMPNRAPNPDGLQDIRRNLRTLSEDITAIKEAINRPSLWSRFWKERNWLIPTAVVVLGALLSLSYYVCALWVDKRINVAAARIDEKIQKISGDVQQIKGTLNILQAQFVAQKYANVRPRELKPHIDELNIAKANLVSADRNVRGFWPTSFQIIMLLSQATSNVELIVLRPRISSDTEL